MHLHLIMIINIRAWTLCLYPGSILSRYLGADPICTAIFKYCDSTWRHFCCLFLFAVVFFILFSQSFNYMCLIVWWPWQYFRKQHLKKHEISQNTFQKNIKTGLVFWNVEVFFEISKCFLKYRSVFLKCQCFLKCQSVFWNIV